MYALLADKRILVVVAHPDDELLGMGGTCHRLATTYGAHIRCVILGEGLTSRSETRDLPRWEADLATHRANIARAGEAIGFASHGIHNLPDNRFDSVALLDIVKLVEQEKADFQPAVIFTHHGGDTNIDHRRTFDAVMTACRPMAHETVRTIVAFETPSSTEWQAANYPNPFLPNLFFELEQANVDAKIKGMESYEFERRAYPHPRSPEALRIQAQRWGVATGRMLAEAAMLIRHIA